jgi:putative ABC transport system permease protein
MKRLTRLLDLPRSSRRGIAAEVDEEISSHIDARILALVSQGLSPDEARAEALRRFGDINRTRDSMYESAQRSEGRVRQRERMGAVLQDAAYTWRQLRHSPGTTLTIALTLALGIGATATMFGAVDRLLLRPPAHVHDPDALARVYFSRPDAPTSPLDIVEVSYRRFTELRAAASSMLELAAQSRARIVSDAATGHLDGTYVSGNFWSVLGVQPALGRFFGEPEDRIPEGSNVVVLSHAYWQATTGGDAAILGRQIELGSRRYTVIGVAPPGFQGISLGKTDVWIPATTIRAQSANLRPNWYTTHAFRWLEVVGRLRHGTTRAQSQSILDAAYSQSVRSSGTDEAKEAGPFRVALGHVSEERGPQRSESTNVATWLTAVAGLVLLLACANVTNLLLARAVARRREIAIRLALGVGRGRLCAQLMVESLLLASLGVIAGVAATLAGARAFHATFLPNVALGEQIFDGRVLTVAVVAGLLAAGLSGLAPMLYAMRTDVSGMLKASSRTGGLAPSRVRGSLLVGQAMLSTVLLICAGLFVRSLTNARSTRLGFDAEHLVTIRAELRDAAPPPGGTAALYRQMAERMRELPGVVHATTTLQVPFSISGSTSLYVPGVDSMAVRRMGEFSLNGVGSDYFETMGTRIVRGRSLNSGDRDGTARVMVVSDSMARALWPGQDALGKCVQVGEIGSPCTVVVGIAENIHQYEIRPEPALQYWFPESQKAGGNQGAFASVARVAGDATSMIPAIRSALQPIVPGNVYLAVNAVSASVERVVRPWRLGAMVLTAFGVLGLAIAAMGLYSVLAYSVTQRSREIGVRLALGARARSVQGMVVASGMRFAVAGVVLGVMAVVAISRWLESVLFGVTTLEPRVVLPVAGVLLATAVAASIIPAWRASRVDPVVTLRSE